MRPMRNRIDKFCYKHPRFGIPGLMKYIVILSAVVYLISRMDTTYTFLNFLQFNPYYIFRGQVWRLVTWIFLPIHGNMLYTVIGLYFYYFIGSTLEQAWGSGKFTLYYIISMLLNIIYAVIMYLVFHLPISITATYINLSMFFAFAVLYPDERVLLFFFIPIKIKWLALVDAALFIYTSVKYFISGAWFFALIPLIALLGFFIYCGSDLIYYIKRSRLGSYNSNTINFKSAARKAKHNEHKQEKQGYRHKCAVCGRTDTEHPELEFRYCSRCAGYHCFCMDHINSHIHFTE